MEQIKRSQHHDSFVTGIIKENPLFVAVLGTCPALAITKSFEAAIGMGPSSWAMTPRAAMPYRRVLCFQDPMRPKA